MKKRNITGTKSLCVAVLMFSTLLFSMPVVPIYAEAETVVSEGYKYAVTIEFGSMTFCYDYGRWDVNEMRYRVDDASQNPASGTVQGYPGWYGFDGIANRISVKYSNENEDDGAMQNRRLSVTLDYQPLFGTALEEVSGITVEFYSDSGLTVPQERSFTITHTALEDVDAKTVIYTSLYGEPRANGNKYLSDSFSPVGVLTIRMGEISD